jgi:hypothetical protein
MMMVFGQQGIRFPWRRNRNLILGPMHKQAIDIGRISHFQATARERDQIWVDVEASV